MGDSSHASRRSARTVRVASSVVWERPVRQNRRIQCVVCSAGVSKGREKGKIQGKKQGRARTATGNSGFDSREKVAQ